MTGPSYQQVAQADHDAVMRIYTALPERQGAGVVQAPPGAGKSTLIRSLAAALATAEQRIAVGTQTTEQADDLVLALHKAHPELRIARLHGSNGGMNAAVGVAAARSLGHLTTGTNGSDLLQDAQIMVAPTQKWAHEAHPSTMSPRAPLRHAFAALLIDESYQMRSDAFSYLPDLAPRMLCVGDPGQLAPFTTLKIDRWNGRGYGPTRPAMEVLRRNHPDLPLHQMHVSWRLPPSTAGLVQDAFYPDVPFVPGTSVQDRQLLLGRENTRGGRGDRRVDAVLNQAARTGWAYVELPEAHTMRADSEIATTLAGLAGRLLERGATIVSELPADHDGRPLRTQDIAVVTAHNDQAAAVRLAMNEAGIDPGITVDTANAIQGREFAVVAVWHPLAGRRDASSFHLEAGRMCVMLTRHRHACIVIGRAGAQQLLEEYPDDHEVVLGEDAAGVDGWYANHRVLEHLRKSRI
ncbi:helicase [Lentzea sp. NBRC 105346]|uniref:AAA domain-containing protein n=1 Tax=Lentzea sp. NBRC 105346 TaxID=3032205 RepID=UPI0024A2956E|nr:AAA domain-containing protein [Lentzea sp. NBRC 105346]GLZ28081.1 helicase [Lentzea sp. NBRC 105346]